MLASVWCDFVRLFDLTWRTFEFRLSNRSYISVIILDANLCLRQQTKQRPTNVCVFRRYDEHTTWAQAVPNAHHNTLLLVRFFLVAGVFNYLLVGFWPVCEWLVPNAHRCTVYPYVRKFVKCMWYKRRQKFNNNGYRCGRQLERRSYRIRCLHWCVGWK